MSSSSSAAAAVVPTVLGRRLLRSSRARHVHNHRRASAAASSSSSSSSASASTATDDSAKLLRQKADAISEPLKGVSITFVGDNEGANVAVANALAKALKYTPLSTPELIERITDSTREEILEEDGVAGLVIAENAVFEQLGTHIRCCVGTSGGGQGAAARGACWDYLFGQFTVWLDDVPAAEKAQAAAEAKEAKAKKESGDDQQGKDKEDEEDEEEDAMAQREAYEFADIYLMMSSPEVNTEAEAVSIALQALTGIEQMIEGDEQLSGKKGFYVKMGCRGDWPVLQPPGWDGTKEGMVDPATGKPYREAQGPQPEPEGPKPKED